MLAYLYPMPFSHYLLKNSVQRVYRFSIKIMCFYIFGDLKIHEFLMYQFH